MNSRTPISIDTRRTGDPSSYMPPFFPSLSFLSSVFNSKGRCHLNNYKTPKEKKILTPLLILTLFPCSSWKAQHSPNPCCIKGHLSVPQEVGRVWANKDILKLASASSSIDPSQGLLHVNKIVKHLLWHLLPLNIHKPVSTGKHPLYCVSWPSPAECKSVLCGTWELYFRASSLEVFLVLTPLRNPLVCKEGRKSHKVVWVCFLPNASKRTCTLCL